MCQQDVCKEQMVMCRLQTLRDSTGPALQRKADSLEADCGHDTQRLEELQGAFALLEHELQVRATSASFCCRPHARCRVTLCAHCMPMRQVWLELSSIG